MVKFPGFQTVYASSGRTILMKRLVIVVGKLEGLCVMVLFTKLARRRVDSLTFTHAFPFLTCNSSFTYDHLIGAIQPAPPQQNKHACPYNGNTETSFVSFTNRFTNLLHSERVHVPVFPLGFCVPNRFNKSETR
jgi:hypothetical protein